jgi:uncharacterized protein YfeS
VTDDDEWDLSPENAHPAARAVMAQSFFWDCVDEDSPLGNDTGADVLAFFREWRSENPGTSPIDFLTELLRGWEVADTDWDVTDPERVVELQRADRFGFEHRDDAIIGLAFAQLVLEGTIDTEVLRRALLALRRQATPAALDSWPGEYRDERRTRLQIMERALRDSQG